MLQIIKKSYYRQKPTFLILFVILFIIITFSVGTWLFNYLFEKENFDLLIAEASKRHAIDPCFVKAVIWKESRFKPYARGKAGEIGLMQIMIPAVKDWARANNTDLPCEGVLFNSRLNIEIGTWYLARATKYWKKRGYKHYREYALCEYNAGRSKIKKWAPKNLSAHVIDYIKIKSTKSYVINIMNKYQEYTRQKKQLKSR